MYWRILLLLRADGWLGSNCLATAPFGATVMHPDTLEKCIDVLNGIAPFGATVMHPDTLERCTDVLNGIPL